MCSPTLPVRSGNMNIMPRSLTSKQRCYPEIKINTPEECSHITADTPQSCDREFRNRTAIIWHTLNTGVEFGICLNCQRQFWPEDRDYLEWRGKESFCVPSSAGKEEPIGPDEVIEYTSPSHVVGDLDIILFGPNAPQIIVRGKEAQ